MDPTPHLGKMLEQHQLMVVQWYCFSGCCCFSWLIYLDVIALLNLPLVVSFGFLGQKCQEVQKLDQD